MVIKDKLEEYFFFVKWKNIIVKGEKEKVNFRDIGRVVFEINMYRSWRFFDVFKIYLCLCIFW